MSKLKREQRPIALYPLRSQVLQANGLVNSQFSIGTLAVVENWRITRKLQRYYRSRYAQPFPDTQG